METTLKIDSSAELDITLINRILKDMLKSFGSIDVIIKPRTILNDELKRRIENVAQGEELISFESSDFDEISKQLAAGISISDCQIKKVKINEKGNIVPANGI